MLAGACCGIIGIGGATVVIVTRWWRNGNVHTSAGIGI